MRTTNKAFYSIRWRMVVGYLLVTLVGFAVVLLSVSGIVESYLVRQRVGEQQRSVDSLAWNIKSHVENCEPANIYNMVVEQSKKLSGRVLFLDADGVVQSDASSELIGRALDYDEVYRVLFGSETAAYGFHERQSDEQPTGLMALWHTVFPKTTWDVYYVGAVSADDGELLGAVLFSTSIQDVKDSVASIRSQVLLVLALVGVCIIIIASLLSNSITKPISELTRVIRRMGRGEFDLRVKVTGRTEVDELARTFNDMSERLENIEQFRSEFVSNASHEIKTPLATIKILTESLMYQDKLDEKVTKEFLGDVNSEIDRLNLVISDLLRMVQIDHNEDTLKPESTDLRGICADAVKRMTPIAGKKNIRLEAELAEATCMCDPVKTEQAVFNIIDNAVKYTDDGGRVRVSLTLHDGFAVIKIADNGIGIPKKDLPHIFDRFYRVDKARSRATGGTGLGLSIVDKIIKLHGGTIDVDSRENEGTTFTIRLPQNGKGK